MNDNKNPHNNEQDIGSFNCKLITCFTHAVKDRDNLIVGKIGDDLVYAHQLPHLIDVLRYMRDNFLINCAQTDKWKDEC